MAKKQSRILMGSLVLLSVLCMVFFWGTRNFALESSELKNLTDGWYTFDESGQKTEVTLPAKISAGTTLEVFHDGEGLEAFTAGQVIATNAAVYDVEIFWNDNSVYRFVDGGREINNPVRSNTVCVGRMASAQPKNTIRLVYHSDSGRYDLPAVTVSTEKELVFACLAKYAWGFFMSLAMVIIGMMAFVLGAVLAAHGQSGARIICIALFLLFCGLWCAADSPLTFYLFAYNELVFDLDFYLFMLMPIPLFYFVQSSGAALDHGPWRWLVALYYLNIATQSVLATMGVFTFFRMLFVSHLLMVVVGVLVPLLLLAREYRRTKQSEDLLALRALGAVGVIGAVAILLYVFFDYAAYQMLFQTGLLLLMTVLLSTLLQEFVESVKNRTEAVVYKQLSEQDKLTKLENRRAFDKLVEKMESGSLRYRNAAMIFADVNFLKRTNDTYGHAAGDELLILAAGCLKSAFGGAGYCYRIGGDEFCAVVLDPSCTAQELLLRLNQEQERINGSEQNAVPLSIACGCCFLTENGVEHTISEWKTLADERMYQNKKEIKAREKNQ